MDLGRTFDRDAGSGGPMRVRLLVATLRAGPFRGRPSGLVVGADLSLPMLRAAGAVREEHREPGR